MGNVPAQTGGYDGGHHRHSSIPIDHHITAAEPDNEILHKAEHVHSFKPSEEELRKLQTQFRSLKMSHGGTVAERLDREAFHHNFAKKLKPQFIDKIFNALDWDHSGVVSFKEFVMLTHILFEGSEDEKIDYLFVLYDSNGDGFLAGDEIGRLAHGSAAAMRSLLRSLAPDQQPPGLPQTPAEKEASEKRLAKDILKAADKDHDGQISIEEFKVYCKKHPELLTELNQLRDLLCHVLGEEMRPKDKSPKIPHALMQPPAAASTKESPKVHHKPTDLLSAPHASASADPASSLAAPAVAASSSPKKSPKIPHAKPPVEMHADDELELEAHKPNTSSSALDKLAT